MAESAEITAQVQKGYLRQIDLVPLLGVTHQRVSQIVQREDFPPPSKMIGRRRLWRRRDVERWTAAQPRVWTPAADD